MTVARVLATLARLTPELLSARREPSRLFPDALSAKPDAFLLEHGLVDERGLITRKGEELLKLLYQAGDVLDLPIT